MRLEVIRINGNDVLVVWCNNSAAVKHAHEMAESIHTQLRTFGSCGTPGVLVVIDPEYMAFGAETK